MRDSKNIRSLKPATPCGKCHGTGTEVVPGNGARACSCRRRRKRARAQSNVVDLGEYRQRAAAKRSTAEFDSRRQLIAERREINETLAEGIITGWHDDRNKQTLFNALLRQAGECPVFYRDQVEAILPTLLEVCDWVDHLKRTYKSGDATA